MLRLVTLHVDGDRFQIKEEVALGLCQRKRYLSTPSDEWDIIKTGNVPVLIAWLDPLCAAARQEM